jgi:hypothetical protein
MKRISLLTLVALSALSGCATTSQVDFMTAMPVVAYVDVAPGYKRSLSMAIPDSNIIELRVTPLRQNPTKKWMPTAFIALNNDDSDVTYGLNITTDTKIQKQYVQARLIDLGAQKELSNIKHEAYISPSSENILKFEISGKRVRSFINDTFVEERDLPFEPSYYDIGASSGSYKLTVIELPPPPAPE